MVIGAVAIPLAVASVAWACARLATLYLNPSKGTAGTDVSAVGRNFNSAPTSSEVTVRFNSRSGRVLWSGRADRNGRVSPRFEIPRARAGHYTIVATQQLANGRPAAGTPARAPLQVTRASSSRSEAPVTPVGAPAGPNGSGPSAGAPAVPLPAILASMLLLLGAAGLGLGSRRATRRAA